MVVSNILLGQKDHIIAKGIGIGLDKVQEYLESEYHQDEDIDLENDPAFEKRDSSGVDIYVFDPNSGKKDNGGENTMVREPNDPDDLGRQTRDARGSAYDLFDSLEDFNDYLNDTLSDAEDEVEVGLQQTRDIIRFLESEVISESLNVQERNYDRADAFVNQVLQPAVAEHYDSLQDLVQDAREFRDEGDYDQVRTELGTMERRGQDFEDEYGLDL